jgi:hypothetical protein
MAKHGLTDYISLLVNISAACGSIR